MLEVIYRFDPNSTEGIAQPADPCDARRRLEDGNREFAHFLDPLQAGQHTTTRVLPLVLRDLGLGDSAGAAPRQQPFAVVLGCSDARVPTEMIFNQACNAMFVVRVAGNVLGSECLGSIDYAVHHLGESIKLVVVLGHSGCGAVTAAVDAYLQPEQFLAVAPSHPLRAIVDRLLLPVRGAARALEGVWGKDVVHRSGYRRALIETSVAANAALTAATLRQEFREQLGQQRDVVFGVYDLVSRHVRLPLADDTVEGDEEVRLVSPPENAEDLVELGSRLAGSDAVAALLNGG